MTSIAFGQAFYIKLGRAGSWESDSIKSSKLRFGWSGQTVEDINADNWDQIEQKIRTQYQDKPAGVATTDLNALKSIVKSQSDDIWITFHQAKLWWARVTGPVCSDDTSKFRQTVAPWSDKDVTGKTLILNELPGKIAQLQGFRGTSCRVQYSELLQRILNGVRSPLATAIRNDLNALEQDVANAIKELHWKDFETLVDLVFRASGWIRVSVLGQQAKAYDLELREPITGYRYVVQVKSQAGVADLHSSVKEFSSTDYQVVFFVVHSPDASLREFCEPDGRVMVIGPEQLAALVVQAGLARWIEDKVV